MRLRNALRFGKMVADMVGQIEAGKFPACFVDIAAVQARAEASEAGEVGNLAPCGQASPAECRAI